MNASLLVAACAVAVLAIASSAWADEIPVVGAPAPGFTLHSQDGGSTSLSQFHGKWVVLYFYPKDMTSGCTIEAHKFQRDLAQYDSRNAVILGVSVDNVDSHQEFCTKESLTFKLLADTAKEVTQKYGSLGPSGMAVRNTFLIDPEGVVRKVYTRVQPNSHSEEVLAALGELQK